MKGAAAVYFLALVFVAQAGKKKGKKDMSGPNEEEDGEHFEGDIILPLPGLDRSGLIDEKYRWKDGIVPYEIGGEFLPAEVALLHSAMWAYRMKTDSCIKFVPRGNEEDYLVFEKHKRGCSSSVGKRGGEQPVKLGARCFRKFGTILHEIMHALGFFHEQSRTDRDDFVKIQWKHIDKQFKGNFRKYSSSVIGPFGVGYDYDSMMHYSQHAFSKDGHITIVPMDSEVKIGQRLGFSEGDLNKLMNMYKCDSKPKPEVKECPDDVFAKIYEDLQR